MSTLNSSQIVRIFSLYCRCVIKLKDGGYLSPLYVENSLLQNLCLPYGHEDRVIFKLLLTPLGQIRDDDALKICQCASPLEYFRIRINVPLTIETGHPFNGLTPFEMNIALDRTVLKL